MKILARKRLTRLRRCVRRGAVPGLFAALLLCSVRGVSNIAYTPQDDSPAMLSAAQQQVSDSATQPGEGKITDPRIKKLARLAAEASGGRYSSSEILEKANQLQALGVRLEDMERYIPEKLRSSLKFRDLKQRAKNYAGKLSKGSDGVEKPVVMDPPFGVIEIGALAGLAAALLVASVRPKVRS